MSFNLCGLNYSVSLSPVAVVPRVHAFIHSLSACTGWASLLGSQKLQQMNKTRLRDPWVTGPACTDLWVCRGSHVFSRYYRLLAFGVYEIDFKAALSRHTCFINLNHISGAAGRRASHHRWLRCQEFDLSPKIRFEKCLRLEEMKGWKLRVENGGIHS